MKDYLPTYAANEKSYNRDNVHEHLQYPFAFLPYEIQQLESFKNINS